MARHPLYHRIGRRRAVVASCRMSCNRYGVTTGAGGASGGGAAASPIPTDPPTATLRWCSKSSFVFSITYLN